MLLSMSDDYNTKTVQSVKPEYNNRPSPRDIPAEFQEPYILACREVNNLLVDADRYFAYEELQDILEDQEDNFRQDNNYSINTSELLNEINPGELVDESELYDQLVDITGSETIEDISNLASTALTIRSKKDSLGDSMDYDTPVSWMMYKREAYDGQSIANGDPNEEIATMGDLRDHADGQDLCKKRYDFLREFTQNNKEWFIDDSAAFPDEIAIEDVYTDERVLGLLVDEEFMGDRLDGANVTDVFGEDITPDQLKEGGRGSWLGNEKDMDGKWANY